MTANGQEPVADFGTDHDPDDYPGCCGWLRQKMDQRAWDHGLLTVMKVTMAMGEFCLLLLVLVVLLEISPADIPKTCKDSTQENCMDQLLENNGTIEFDDGVSTCGSMRVACWRGSNKNILYKNNVASGKTSIDYQALGLSARTLETLQPRLEYCVCLLTLEGTVPMPESPTSWRSDTDFFCETLNSVNAGLGALGFFIGTALVLFKVL